MKTYSSIDRLVIRKARKAQLFIIKRFLLLIVIGAIVGIPMATDIDIIVNFLMVPAILIYFLIMVATPISIGFMQMYYAYILGFKNRRIYFKWHFIIGLLYFTLFIDELNLLPANFSLENNFGSDSLSIAAGVMPFVLALLFLYMIFFHLKINRK